MSDMSEGFYQEHWGVDDLTVGEEPYGAPTGVDPLLAIHALDIQTFLGYHDTSVYDPPSSHDPGVEDLWDCPPCVERFIERAHDVLAGSKHAPAPEPQAAPTGVDPREALERAMDDLANAAATTDTATAEEYERAVDEMDAARVRIRALVFPEPGEAAKADAVGREP